MNKMQNQNSINLEDVKKLTKYQVRLLNLKGGSNEHETYKFKVKEYSEKLSRGGVNVARLIDIIGGGGDPLTELRSQRVAILGEIDKLAVGVDRTDLTRQLTEISTIAQASKEKYDKLVNVFGTNMTETAKFQTDARRKLAGKNLSGVVSLSQEEVDGVTNNLIKDDTALAKIYADLSVMSHVIRFEDISAMVDGDVKNAERTAEFAAVQSTVVDNFGGNKEAFLGAMRNAAGTDYDKITGLVEELVASVKI